MEGRIAVSKLDNKVITFAMFDKRTGYYMGTVSEQEVDLLTALTFNDPDYYLQPVVADFTAERVA